MYAFGAFISFFLFKNHIPGGVGGGVGRVRLAFSYLEFHFCFSTPEAPRAVTTRPKSYRIWKFSKQIHR